MTNDRLKRRVRAHMAEHDVNYTTALREVRAAGAAARAAAAQAAEVHLPVAVDDFVQPLTAEQAAAQAATLDGLFHRPRYTSR